MPVPRAGRMPWRRRLARCAFGVGTAVMTGWLTIVVGLAIYGISARLTGQMAESGTPLGAAFVFGFFGAITAAPLTFLIGAPIWLLADKGGLNRPRHGAVAGALIGIAISLIIPFLLLFLPLVGALAGYVGVYAANRAFPKPAPF